MLYPRFLKIGTGVAIVAFWAGMTGWFVQANWSEGNAPFSDLPPTLVLGQVLKHEAVSQLGIYRGRHRIGAVTITPVHAPADSLSFDGVISIPGEGPRPETYNFSLRTDLAADLTRAETITLRFRRKNPPLVASAEILLKEQKLRYEIKNGSFEPGPQELPLQAGGFSGMLPSLVGLPALPTDAGGFLKSVEIRANRARLTIRGEQMDGFRVVLTAAAGLQATITLGQLGEIFILRTSTDYHLLADGLEPVKYLP